MSSFLRKYVHSILWGNKGHTDLTSGNNVVVFQFSTKLFQKLNQTTADLLTYNFNLASGDINSQKNMKKIIRL
jgi:hypothetical protein